MPGPLISVIKYEGDNSTFIWKHPVEDFHTGSQLIVHENQEAIFFKNGQALDLFSAGKYTLTSGNLPLVDYLVNGVTGSQSPFHCEVYFINKAEQMAIRWGTDNKIEYMDPIYKFPVKIGASGEMSIKVIDSRKLLLKIVGTEKMFTQESLTQKFRAFLNVHAKTYFTSLLCDNNIDIFSVDRHLMIMSEALRVKLIPDFSDYGLSLERFFVTTLVKPEDDKGYQRARELYFRQFSEIGEAELRKKVAIIEQETQAEKSLIESAARAKVRKQEGYSYHTERAYDVAEKVAQNEGVGNFSSAGVGMGIMSGVAMGMGPQIASIASSALNPILTDPYSNPSRVDAQNVKPGIDSPPALLEFTDETNREVNANNGQNKNNDFVEFDRKLRKLLLMKELGALNEEEFASEKKKLLDNL